MTHEEFVRTAHAENLRLLEKAKAEGRKTIGFVDKTLIVKNVPIDTAEKDVEKTAIYMNRFKN